MGFGMDHDIANEEVCGILGAVHVYAPCQQQKTVLSRMGFAWSVREETNDLIFRCIKSLLNIRSKPIGWSNGAACKILNAARRRRLLPAQRRAASAPWPVHVAQQPLVILDRAFQHGDQTFRLIVTAPVWHQ